MWKKKQDSVHLFYYKRNAEILEELKVELDDEKLRRYKSKCYDI
jgi:hypothetical protein